MEGDSETDSQWLCAHIIITKITTTAETQLAATTEKPKTGCVMETESPLAPTGGSLQVRDKEHGGKLSLLDTFCDLIMGVMLPGC